MSTFAARKHELILHTPTCRSCQQTGFDRLCACVGLMLHSGDQQQATLRTAVSAHFEMGVHVPHRNVLGTLEGTPGQARNQAAATSIRAIEADTTTPSPCFYSSGSGCPSYYSVVLSTGSCCFCTLRMLGHAAVSGHLFRCRNCPLRCPSSLNLLLVRITVQQAFQLRWI